MGKYVLLSGSTCQTVSRRYRTSSDDRFYRETKEGIEKLSALGCLNAEMESSALYTVCHRRKKHGVMLSAVSGNLITGEVIYGTVTIMARAVMDIGVSSFFFNA